MIETKMKVAKKADGYWVNAFPIANRVVRMARRLTPRIRNADLEHFFRHCDEPGFITCEDERLKRHGKRSEDTT